MTARTVEIHATAMSVGVGMAARICGDSNCRIDHAIRRRRRDPICHMAKHLAGNLGKFLFPHRFGQPHCRKPAEIPGGVNDRSEDDAIRQRRAVFAMTADKPVKRAEGCTIGEGRIIATACSTGLGIVARAPMASLAACIRDSPGSVSVLGTVRGAIFLIEHSHDHHRGGTRQPGGQANGTAANRT